MSDADNRFQRFNLRLPRELMQKLAEAAESRTASVNAEIVARLSASFPREAPDDWKVEPGAWKIGAVDVREMLKQVLLLNRQVQSLVAKPRPRRPKKPYVRKK